MLKIYRKYYYEKKHVFKTLFQKNIEKLTKNMER